MKPDHAWSQTSSKIEQQAPSRLSDWRYPAGVLLIGDAALESGRAQDGANTDGTLRDGRLHHEAVQAQTLSATETGGLDRFDMFRPDQIQCHMVSVGRGQYTSTRRAGTIMHMKRYCNWLWADGHVDRLIDKTRSEREWLALYGVRNPNKTFSN